MNKRVLLCFLGCMVFLTACKVNHYVQAVPQSYTVEESLSIKPDSLVASMVNPYKAKLDEEMNKVIGTLAIDLEKGSPESPLGNLVADALKIKAIEYSGMEIDFAVSNSGGLRIPMLNQGEVTKSDIFELLPFDNILVILEMDAELLKTFINHMAAQRGWPVSEGLEYVIVQSEADKIRINGEPIVSDKLYKVALPDYIANGGGNSAFLRNIPQITTKRYMRDAVIEYIQESKTPISAQIEGRVQNYN